MRNLRNLDVGTQSQDPENAQRNLEIMQISRLRRTLHVALGHTLACISCHGGMGSPLSAHW